MIKMAPLTVEDRSLIIALQTEKGRAVNRTIVDFVLILESGLSKNFVYVTNYP